MIFDPLRLQQRLNYLLLKYDKPVPGKQRKLLASMPGETYIFSQVCPPSSRKSIGYEVKYTYSTISSRNRR